MIGKTIHRFRILAKAGEGGMGIVWRAEDTLLGRCVALKFLPEAVAENDDARRRFLREARAASALDHPGIATVYEAGEAEGRVYIAFQLVEGETLAQRIGHGALPVAEALRIAQDAAAALEHAHSEHIVHRDVTARNIMIEPDGRVVVVDFGLAVPEEGTRLTMTPSLMGTAAYMAPEVIQGRDADRRSDLYGLGVVLFEMLTGGLPFQARRTDALLYATVHQEVSAPSKSRPGLHMDIDTIVLKLLAKDPTARYQNAGELIRDLGSVLQMASDTTATVAATVALPSRRARAAPAEWIRSLRWPWILAVAVILAAIAVLYVLRRDEVPRGPTRSSPISSLAVLPLENISENPEETEYLAKGIARSLCTKLDKLSDLNVIPWRTSQRYRDPDKPLEEIVAELKVTGLIAGTFQQYRDRINVTISLIDAATGNQTWSEEFEQLRTDVLVAQRELAVEAARQIVGSLTGDDLSSLESLPTGNASAFDHYLHGAEEMERGTREGVQRALIWFQKAIEVDASLAEAHVGIGAVHMDRFFHGWEGGLRNLELARQHFTKAVELDPDLLQARRGLIHMYWEQRDLVACLEEGQRVTQLEKQGIEELLTRAEAYYFGGLANKAIPLFEQALGLDPANEEALWFLVTATAWAGDFEATLEASRAYLLRFGLDEPEVHLWTAFAYQGLRDLDRANFHYDRSLALFGDHSNVYVNLFAGASYWQAGDSTRARQIWRDGMEVTSSRLAAFPDNYRLQEGLAEYHAVLGQRDPFLEQMAWLETNDRRLGDPVRSICWLFAGDGQWHAEWVRDPGSDQEYMSFYETLVRVWNLRKPDAPASFLAYMDELEKIGDQLRSTY